MPGVNLARAEAAARSAHLKVDSYLVELDLTTGAEVFRAKTTVKFSSSKPGTETFIDAVGRTLHSATLNGVPLDPSVFDGESVHLKILPLKIPWS